MNDVEYVELLSKLFQTLVECRTYTAKEIWLNYAFEHDNKSYTEYEYLLPQDEEQLKYQLFSALDNRFPLLMVKFYDKHKLDLHRIDPQFIQWLFLRSKQKADVNKTFKKIYETMCKEASNQRNTLMHLN